MTLLRFDLTTIATDNAEIVRKAYRILIADGDPKVRLLNNETILELDYGIFELEQFEYIVPSPRTVLKAIQMNGKKLVEDYETPEYRQMRRDKVDESRDAFRDFDYNSTTVDNISADLTDKGSDGVEKVLANQPGLLIGGEHGDNTHREPIMDMLESGALSAGNKTGLLFIEELPQSSQQEIDTFLESSDEMPPKLKKYLELLSTNYACDFVRMMELARANGVRVVGTDAEEAKIQETVASAIHHERRCAAQNKVSLDIMKQAIAKDPTQKFVALIGAAHSNTHAGGVPGLSQLLGVPAVNMAADGTMEQQVEDPAMRKVPPSGKAAEFIDMYLTKLEAETPGEAMKLMNSHEQRQAAEKMADMYIRGSASGGLLHDGCNVEDLFATDPVARSIQETIKHAEDRMVAKQELATLLKTDITATDFDARVIQLKQDYPDLLDHDGDEGMEPGLSKLAADLGKADLVKVCLDQGAPNEPHIGEKLIEGVLNFHMKEISEKGVDPAVAGANLAASVQTLLDGNVNPDGNRKRPVMSPTNIEENVTPLQKMIRDGMTGAAITLIDGGAATTVPTGEGHGLLEVALRADQAGTLGALITKGFDPDAPGADGQPLLITALKLGKTDIVKTLVARGADVNVVGADGKSALHLAAEAGDKSVIDALINGGGDPTVADANGDTAAKALVVSELRRQIDQKTNGDYRAIQTLTAEIEEAQVDLAAKTKAAQDLQAEHTRLTQQLMDTDQTAPDFDNQAMQGLIVRLAALSATDIPAANLALAQAQNRGPQLQTALDQHQQDNPMRPMIETSKAQIAADEKRAENIEVDLNRAKGYAKRAETEEDRQQAQAVVAQAQQELQTVKNAIKTEQAHLASMQAPQPIDDELLLRTADALLTGYTGPLNTGADIDLLFANSTAQIDDLRDKMLDRQTKVQQMADAVKTANAGQITALAQADPTLVDARVPGDEINRTMINYAAKNQNLAAVQALIANHADVTARDGRKATPIHSVFNSRQDNPGLKTVQKDIMTALLVAGADIDAQDRQDRTCLHVACLDGNPDAITELLARGANETITDERGWTPREVVVATTKPLAEKAYADAAHQNISPKLIPDDADFNFEVDTVTLLMGATRCENSDDRDRMEEMYRNLYAQPMFRDMLDLVATDAAHSHVAKDDGTETETGLRIMVADNKQVSLLYNRYYAEDYETTPYSDAPLGTYDDQAHVVMLGAAPSEGTFVAGTLIHELTHAAGRLIYGTEDIPGDVPDGGFTDQNGKLRPEAEDSPYVQAIIADARNAAKLGDPGHLKLNSDDKRIHETLFGRMETKYKGKGDKALLQEYLVSIPQLVAEFGREPVARIAPSLVNYYETSFADACNREAQKPRYADVNVFLNNEALLAELPPPEIRAPESKITAKSARNSLDDILGTVKNACISANGTPKLADKDAALNDKLSLPFGSGNFELTRREQKALDKKISVIKKALKDSYDPNDLPREFDASRLVLMTDELTRLAETQSGKALKNSAAAAAGAFVRDTRSVDLEARYAQGELLKNRDVAELILLRAEDEAWRQAHGGGIGAAPRIAFDAKQHAKALDAMETKLTEFMDAEVEARKAQLPEDSKARDTLRARLLGEATDVQAFIDQQVQVLSADRNMSVGRSDEVKINVKRLKQAWYAQLQGLAA